MKIKLLLVVAVVLGGLLRFWTLGSLPPSLTWDEVAWGYNAYSLGIDGKDEFGKFLPLTYLESFGDYKPPVYAYLDVLPIKILGLNEFATRFPSAFLGTLTVLITYFLTKRFFPTSKKRQWYGLTAAFFLAISPWHIMLSRAAFEANVATFFIATGAWLFLCFSQDKKWWYLLLSTTCFILPLYTFNSARVVAPLLFITLCIFFWKTLFAYKKVAMTILIYGMILVIPFIQFSLSPQSKLRYNEVNIFSDSSLVKNANQQIANDKNAWWSKILHNRRLVYSVAYLQHYLDNLSPSFLFDKGDGNPKFSTRDVGQLYLWDIPFLIIGILFLLRKKIDMWWLIPLWILFAIVPAGVARETPHALRTENMLPMWQILVGVGFVEVYFYFKKLQKLFLVISLLTLSLFVLYFQHGYYTHYGKEFSGEWQYGYKDALAFSKSVSPKYDQIIMTSALGRPYIYVLFYNKITPKEFQQTSIVRRDAFGFVSVEKVGKYLFPTTIPEMKNTLYIVTSGEVPSNVKIMKTFMLLNGQPSLVAYTL